MDLSRTSVIELGLRRQWLVGWLLAGFSLAISYSLPCHSLAQENDAAAPAAAVPQPAPAAAAPAPPVNGATPTVVEPQSYLEWTFNALGWTYTLAFLFLSITLVAMTVMNMLFARRDSVCPVSLVEAFENCLNEKKYQEAYELAKNDDSFLGQVLSAGLAKLSTGYPQAIEAMQEVGEEENMKLEHRLSYLSLVGTISPLVGLLGTVHGMIMSFEVIARSETSPKPSELAQGISTALVTTLVGLILAIPAIAAFTLLKNRFARLVLEVGIVSENLMSRFDTKKK